MRAAVAAARRTQLRRAGKANGGLNAREVDRHCVMEPAAESLLRRAAARFRLSARSVHRVRKVARTIADLAGADALAAPHVAEALGYRGALEREEF